METGIPQINIDQLNSRYSLSDIDVMTQEQYDCWFESLPPCFYEVVDSGGVLNFTTECHKLTRRKLVNQDDWGEWQSSEWKQLDMYESQYMFGTPCKPTKKWAIFNLIWTYVLKLDGTKKSRCTCDGSSRGQVRVLDHTFANALDQTSGRLFYAVAAAENLLVYGSDASNAFGEAPPPKQGFFIRPDKAFRAWWAHKGRPPIPDGYVIPVEAAMQGHPESPRLWEKHIDKILRRHGLHPTVHEPCLYSGVISAQRVVFKRQVDDFAIATTNQGTADKLFDLINSNLQIPLKRQGLISLYNGLDILQSRWFVKVSIQTWLLKIMEPYFNDWLDVPSTPYPIPLGTSESFIRRLYEAVGDPSLKVQRDLEKSFGFGYRKALGQLIWPMTTCRPDLSQSVVKCAQASACPSELHFKAIMSIFGYLAATID